MSDADASAPEPPPSPTPAPDPLPPTGDEPGVQGPHDRPQLVEGGDEAAPEPEAGPGPGPEAATEPEPEVEAEPEPEAEPAPEVETPAEAEVEVDAEPEPEAGAGAGLDVVADRVDALATTVEGAAREETVTAGFAGLRQGLEELVRLSRRADEHVGELHAENQRLRAGELASVTLPLMRDVVRLHDEVVQLASACRPEARLDLDLARRRLLDTLARWGLTPFVPEVGSPLDPTRHQGVGRALSSDGEPGTIATVRRPGFAHDDGRVFRAAEVEVFQAPPEPAADPESPEGPETPETDPDEET